MAGLGAAPTETIDMLSPELVLVDPSLREAWQRRPDEPALVPHDEPARAEDDPVAAVRMLAGAALDAEVRPRLRSKARRLRVVAAATTAAAVGVTGFLVADALLDLSDPPTTGVPAGEVALTTTPVPASRGRPVPPGLGTRARVATEPVTRFVWAPVDGATSYHVELYRGDTRVFAKRTPEAEVEIPEEWRFEGRRHHLESERYDWYVWPVVAGRRSATAVVQAPFVVDGR
jgi:hypothetical protein